HNFILNTLDGYKEWTIPIRKTTKISFFTTTKEMFEKNQQFDPFSTGDVDFPVTHLGKYNRVYRESYVECPSLDIFSIPRNYKLDELFLMNYDRGTFNRNSLINA